MSASEYDTCLARLRYVKYGDYVLTDDVNAKIDCLKTARNWMENMASRYGVDPKYVYELDPYISALRYVLVGDTIEPEHHNSIVDALKKLREVLEKIEGLIWQEGYNQGYNEGYTAGAFHCKPRLEINPAPDPQTFRRIGLQLAIDPAPDPQTYRRIGLTLSVWVT